MSYPDQIIERGARALHDSLQRGVSDPIEWESLDEATRDYYLHSAYIVLSSTELDLRIHFMETTLNKVPPAAMDYLARLQIQEGPVQTSFKSTKALAYLKDEITRYEHDHIRAQLDAFDEPTHD